MSDAFTKIIATGSGPFPLDMLRFHQAWPASSSDAEIINASILMDERGKAGRHTVGLLTATEYVGPHSLRRWGSFGWSASVIDSLVHPDDEQSSPTP